MAVLANSRGRSLRRHLSAFILPAVAMVILSCAPVGGESPSPQAEKAPATGKEQASAKNSDGWGPEVGGLRTRLLPVQKEYVIGKPAKFCLEMKNFGKIARSYDDQGATQEYALRILDRDGKAVPFVVSYQTSGCAKTIAPGETVVIFDLHDMAGEFLFAKPGRYSIQFIGLEGSTFRFDVDDGQVVTSDIPPSNTITIEMKPGKLPFLTQVPARLIEVLPKGWALNTSMRVIEVDAGKIAPSGWSSGLGTYVSLEVMTKPETNYKKDILGVAIWVAESKLDWTGKGPTGKEIQPSDAPIYLGKGADGHVYAFIPERANDFWPDISAKIKAALKIEE